MGAPPRAAWRDGPALGFALLFPAAMTWVYFVALHQEDAADNPGLKLAYSLGKALQFLFPLAYIALCEPILLRQRPQPPGARGLLLGLGFGLLVVAAMLLAYFAALRDSPQLAHAPGMIFSRLRQFGLATPGGFLGVAVFYSVVHSFLEEYYWRWFVFGRLRRYVPLAAAVVVSSLGFTLHHVVILCVYFPWPLALAFSLAVGVGGAIWAWLYERSGSLLAPWLSHLLVDAGIMIVGYAMLASYWP